MSLEVKIWSGKTYAYSTTTKLSSCFPTTGVVTVGEGLEPPPPVTTLELRFMPLVTCPPEKLLSEFSLKEGPENLVETPTPPGTSV